MDTGQSVAEVTFTAFDFETTGLYPATDKIIEFGAVRFKAGEIIGTFDALANPGVAIPEQAGAVSGISDDMVASQPAVAEVVPKFVEFLSDTVLVAHNAAFDLGFLRAALQEAGHGDIKNSIIDTVVLAQRAFPRQKSYGLQNLVESLGLARGTAHRGLDDAVMCMRLFQACVEALSFMGEITLGEVLT